MLRRHAEREPARLVAAVGRQGFADQRDQPGRGGADIDDGGERQPCLAPLQAEGEAERVHQHRLALAGQAVDQLEAVVPAVARAERQGLAVRRPEQVPRLRRRPRYRRRAADREQAQRLGERDERGLCGGPAAEPRDGGHETLQRIARQRGEHRLAPALRDLLQAAEPTGERPAVLRPDPGEQPEPQPDDGVGVGAERSHVPERVADEQAVGRREGEEGRRDPRHGRVEAMQPAALDQERDPAGQAGRREPRHQLGEGARAPGPERHVERAVEPLADADAGAGPLRLADQQLRSQRRREGAGLRRLGEPRRRVVVRRDRAPVRRGRRAAVDHAAHDTQSLLLGEPCRHDPGLGEHRADGVEQRLVAGPEPFRREVRALRLAGAGQPVAQAPAQRLPFPLQPVARQHRRARPAGQHQGLGGDQRREPFRPLRQQVVQVETEAGGLAAHGFSMSRRKRLRFVGRALEHHVERMAGKGEGGVEPARGDLHEAVELFRPHHRARAVEAQKRDQRAIAADQRPAAAVERNGGLGRQKTLQRLSA